MWGALQDAASTITLLLDKSGEGHRKCPRCRGSGLLGNAFMRPEKKGAHLNQPCWFCEGVGALPIAGLNGFVLARALPCLKAPDKLNQPCVDVLQLNHSRFCKKTGKFTYAKLGASLADLSFDLNTSPWVNCTSLGGHRQIVFGKSEANERVIHPGASEPRQHPLSGFSQNDICSKNRFLQRILMNTPLVLSILNNLQPKKARLSPPPSAILVPVNQKSARFRSVLKLEGAFAVQNVPNVSTRTECLDLEPKLLGLESQTAADVVVFKRRKVRRKVRNCIRDKAAKEAEERAQGLLRTLKCKGEPDWANSLGQPEPMEATSRTLQGLKVYGEGSFRSDVPSRVVWLASVAVVARQVLLKRLIADSFEVPMPATAKPSK